MVEVFKTNVQETVQAERILAELAQHFPGSHINFDLEDCDKVLRIDGTDFQPEQIMHLLQANGYVCQLLDE